MNRFLLLCLFLLAAGCGGTAPAESPWMPIADVPTDVATAAQKKLPQVKFDQARVIKKNGEDVYEIRGKQPNGKVREVEVNTAGVIVEVE
ncbi:MAG TPA: hypothetical protein VMF30_08500 [Pirellulales bacterium]|nr:hypothetical protein [Pirellulales bacterium]